MLRKISLSNKPLSLELQEEVVYFGDSRGYIFKMVYPFLSLSRIYDVDSPVSSLVWHENRMFYGTWDGEVGVTDFKTKHSIQIDRDLVKSMIIFKGHVFVSIDHVVYVLGLNLNLIDKIEVPHKVLCFYKSQETLLVGMGVPFLGKITMEEGKFKLEDTERAEHDTSILSIHKDLTGSSDGKIIRHGEIPEILYSSTGWIRSIFSEDLFSCGKKVVERKFPSKEYGEVYAHEDDVMGVVKVKDKILSIGLDYSLCVYEEEELFDDELREIEELNKLY